MAKTVILLLCLLNFSFARIIALEPSGVEILYSLEAQDEIMAIAPLSNSQIWPHEKTSKLKTVGSYISPDIDKILELKPELVLTNIFHENGLSDTLNSLGIKTLLLNANSVDEIYENINTLATITQRKERAEVLIDELEQSFKKFNNKPFAGKKVAIVFAISPISLLNENTLAGDILKRLGFKNIANFSTQSNISISDEQMLKLNPDFIVIVDGMGVLAEDFTQNQNFKELNAVKNSKVIAINSPLLLRATPRIKVAIDEIYNALK
ncbi:ABC transporter substrate-binding protein [Campylobacter sp. 9BO]|uniref:ABC transporter substrate-binding protein n=1 Tax=Campylobacter sp. 9BO TaxID=3424759 RepID=UPI003D32C3C0